MVERQERNNGKLQRRRSDNADSKFTFPRKNSLVAGAGMGSNVPQKRKRAVMMVRHD